MSAPAAPAATPPRARRAAPLVLAAATTGLAAGMLLAVVGRAAVALGGTATGPWVLGRAAGATAFLLLTALVGTGLLLAHPASVRLRRPSPRTRLRLHAGLSAFTLAFVVLHVAVLATDRRAGVGWRGSLIPFASSYRPLPVTLGVLGLDAGLLAGATSALAGRVAGRLWWPVHKVASASLVLAWFHGVLAGSDTVAWRALYAVGGALILALATSRYLARRPHEGNR